MDARAWPCFFWYGGVMDLNLDLGWLPRQVGRHVACARDARLPQM